MDTRQVQLPIMITENYYVLKKIVSILYCAVCDPFSHFLKYALCLHRPIAGPFGFLLE